MNSLRNAIPEIADLIYSSLGQHGVIDFALMLQDKDYFTFTWGRCEPCEYNSPYLDSACLVCGTLSIRPSL